MIKLASWFSIKDDRVRVLSISNSELKGVRVDGKVECLVPSWELVRKYKYEGLKESEFEEKYREELRKRWNEVYEWLMSLDESDDIVLCCWEKEGEFCHRKLVFKMLKKWRSDLKIELK